MIQNPLTNTCLTFTERGQNVLFTPCDKTNPKQHWLYKNSQIRSQFEPDSCVDSYDRKIIPGTTTPKIWSCSDSENQKFNFDRGSISSDGYFFDIMNAKSPKLTFWNKSSNPTQQFKYLPNISESYEHSSELVPNIHQVPHTIIPTPSLPSLPSFDVSAANKSSQPQIHTMMHPQLQMYLQRGNKTSSSSSSSLLSTQLPSRPQVKIPTLSSALEYKIPVPNIKYSRGEVFGDLPLQGNNKDNGNGVQKVPISVLQTSPFANIYLPPPPTTLQRESVIGFLPSTLSKPSTLSNPSQETWKSPFSTQYSDFTTSNNNNASSGKPGKSHLGDLPKYEVQAQPQLVPLSLQMFVTDKSQLINLYIRDQNEQKYLNEYIPKENPKSVYRLATYNVHFWTPPGSNGPTNLEDFYAIMKVISEINSDILILQEVSFAIPNIDKEFFRITETLGFKYSSFCRSDTFYNGFFGNYILSKFPIKNSHVIMFEKEPTRQGKCAVIATISLDSNTDIVCIGTHLDHESDILREKQMKQILQYVSKIQAQQSSPQTFPRKIQSSNVIISGDFNSLRRQDYTKNEFDFLKNMGSATKVTELLEYTGWKTSFSMISNPMKESPQFTDLVGMSMKEFPKSTSWAGRAIDHIYFKPGMNYNIVGSYIYHDSASDHLPVIVDFQT